MDDREGALHEVALRWEAATREGDSREIIATYREIADHFGLKGPDQGRTKAKRAGWQAEPQNHPADPLRIRVPREAWEAATQARERGLSLRSERETARKLSSQARQMESHTAHEPPALTSEIPALISQLEAVHTTLREGIERAEAAAAEARALANRRADELAELRERLGRAETEALALREQAKAERDRAERRVQEIEAQWDNARAELGAWTAGGPLARAWRAFLNR
jgi:DNA repair exonuclease SbcCD ATPase subunit